MYLYFLLIRIAALCGHKKARALVGGQSKTIGELTQSQESLKGAIWFHAASVGEFEQARPLIERLRREQPSQKIVVTFFSPSGYEMRKDYASADKVLYLPFATRRNARRFLDALQPSMAIFVKYEFWPAYLRALKKRGIPTYSISAIFRPKQLFFLPWGKSHLALLKCFTHIYVQDEASQRLLAKYGIAHCSVAGDTRFDRMQELRDGKRKLNDISRQIIEQFVKDADHVIVAGSTWPKDEELLVRYIKESEDIVDRGRIKLILVPHEIDETHMHYIFQLLQGRFMRYSVLAKGLETNGKCIMTPSNVLVIDAMGLLSSLYPYGQVAYVGGGFGAGIHNTVEAAAYGMPVLFGPNYQHFREAIGLIQSGAAASINDYRSLEITMNETLLLHRQMGTRATAYVEAETGASNKIYNEIFHF